MLRRLLPVLCLVSSALWPAAAAAQGFPIFNGFHSVLAFGEGQSTTASGLAAFESGGSVPGADLSQQQQYEGLEQAWPAVTAANLGTYYKDSDFLAEPSPSALGGLTGSVGSSATGNPPAVETPEQGVTVVREPPYDVPRIYADTRAEAMWAAGYVTAEDRLFFMDVLRHTAEGTMSELLGASSAQSDSAQLGVQDASPAQLTAEGQALQHEQGALGARAYDDITQYIDGINAFINLTKIDPARLPAEYPALGITPRPWTLADTAAEGVYLIGQFTVFGGPQPQQAEALRIAERRLGKRRGAAVYNDLRLAGDPSAAVTLPKSFHSDDPGPVNPASEALIDPGSFVLRDAQTGGPMSSSSSHIAAASAAQAVSRLPAWARRLAGGLGLPHLESNAVLLGAKRSGSGQALAVMGPQVGYYTPEVFLEYEMHAPGIDVSGVSFPGASPYPLIGHGTDYAWTGTSAFSANEDVFAEKLCNPDGSKPSFASSHYMYKGRCVPFSTGEIVEQTPVAPTSPSPPETITMHTLNSVHGPIRAYATAGRAPVALSVAAATVNHEALSYVAFMLLSEPGAVNSPQSFIAAMHNYTGSENWFYVDNKNIAVYQSGWFPVHARGTNPDFPIWGTGKWDWKGFQPTTDGYVRLSPSANPVSIDPPQGYLVNWNNALAHGWRVGAGDWENGPVVRATMLQDDLDGALRSGPVDLVKLTNMVTGPSLTSDLRGMAVWPFLRRLIGRSANAEVRRLVSLLATWAANGSQRRSLASGGDVQDGPAVLLMDAWWPLLVRAEFQPVVGQPLMNLINANFNSIQPDGIRDGSGNGFFAGWEMDVQQDLRQVLGQRVAGRFSRTYCGGGSLKRCRALLTRTLLQAAGQLRAKYGASQSKWQLPTLCSVTTPPSCDQIVPTSAGAISIPPQPFDNRGTFYQAVAVSGHRP
jgi:acyl-homoserine lactone acylase PvdQ